MNTMCLCDRLHLRNLQIRNILRADISLRSAWRTDRHIAYRLDVMLYQIIIKLLLLEAYMKLKLTWLPMGKLLMAIDLVVIVAVALAFRSLGSALYGLVALYISSIVMDGVLYGLDNAKVAYIISDRYQAICDAIIHDIDRGVTILQGVGAYSGTEKKVLLVAFKQKQIVALKRAVKEIDPVAFLIVCEAHEVLGDGFREYKQNDL